MKNKNSNLFLLRFLCILTFIGSGFGALISTLSLIDLGLISFTKEIPGYTSIVTNSFDAGFFYIIVKLILYSASILSAILIWKLKISGYFIYIAAQLLLPSISFFFFPYPVFHTFSIVLPELIFAVAFILLYSLHLDLLKKPIKSLDIEPENH